MTADILTFPPRARFRAQVAAGDSAHRRARRTYGFAEVCGLLTLVGQQRTMLGYLRDLRVQCAMPGPLNPRRWGGQLLTGPAAIDSRSVWDAPDFDAWLASRRSPSPAGLAAGIPPLPRAVRADMAERAQQLARA